METVIWKQIDNYPNYIISTDARVINLNYMNTGKPKLIEPTTKGRYLKVGLRNENGTKTFRLHRLVAEAFIEKPDDENKNQIDHIDANRNNCKVSNLRYVTAKENMHNPNSFYKWLAVIRSPETRKKMSESHKIVEARKKEMK